MHLKWIDGALIGLVMSMGAVFYVAPKMIEQQVNHRLQTLQAHPYCQPTEKHTTWVAMRGNSLRCFAMKKQYPFKVTSWYLPTENDSTN